MNANRLEKFTEWRIAKIQNGNLGVYVLEGLDDENNCETNVTHIRNGNTKVCAAVKRPYDRCTLIIWPSKSRRDTQISRSRFQIR